MADGVSEEDDICLKMIRDRVERSLPPDIRGSREKEIGERFIPVCCDPREYFRILRETGEYKGVIEKRLQAAIQKFPDIAAQDPLSDNTLPTREEVSEVYEERDSFKQLFWNFYQDALHLSFVPGMYSTEFNQAFSEYQDKAFVSVKAAHTGDADEIIEKDRIRSEAHNKVAGILVKEGFAPNEFQARMIIRAFLVDLREDFIASARAADHIRKLRSLPDERTRRAYQIKASSIDPAPEFTSEAIQKIRASFDKAHPNAPYVDPAPYTIDPHQQVVSRRDARSGE